MRRLSLAVLGFLAIAQPLGAQLVVHDPAVTARNALTAALKEYILNTQREEHRQFRRMARRLSLFTDLVKFAAPDVPRWRTHGGDFLFAQAFNEALIFGDPAGAAYLVASHPVVDGR